MNSINTIHCDNSQLLIKSVNTVTSATRVQSSQVWCVVNMKARQRACQLPRKFKLPIAFNWHWTELLAIDFDRINPVQSSKITLLIEFSNLSHNN